MDEDDQMLSSEVAVLDMDVDGEGEQTVALREEFGDLEVSKEEKLAELRDRKVSLMNTFIL